jgi:hypothetical protein
MRRKRDWESCKYSIAIHGSEKLDDPFDIRTNGFYCYGCRNKEIVDLNVYPIEMRNEDGSDLPMLYNKGDCHPIKIAALHQFLKSDFIEGRKLDKEEKANFEQEVKISIGNVKTALRGCTHCRFYKK